MCMYMQHVYRDGIFLRVCGVSSSILGRGGEVLAQSCGLQPEALQEGLKRPVKIPLAAAHNYGLVIMQWGLEEGWKRIGGRTRSWRIRPNGT